MMVIKTVKHNEEQTCIKYATDDTDTGNQIELTCKDQPLPAFEEAFQELVTVATSAIPEMDRLGSQTICTGISMSGDAADPKATITLQTRLSNFTSLLKWKTPAIRLDPEAGIINGSLASDVWNFLDKARDYVNGERQQAQLGFEPDTTGEQVDIGLDESESFTDAELKEAMAKTGEATAKVTIKEIAGAFGIQIDTRSQPLSDLRTTLIQKLAALK